MSFAATSSKNQNSSKSAATTTTVTIAGANLASGDFIILNFASDNSQTTDGDSTLVSGVACTNMTFTKIGEYTNGNGTAATGATVSVWLGLATGTVTTTTTITVTHTSRTARGVCYQGFSKTGSQVWVAGLPIRFVADAADPASQTVAGLSNEEHLFVMAIAHEATNTLTWSTFTNYTAFDNTSGNCGTSGSTADTNMTARAAYRILTATTDTLNVAASTTSDHAGIYFAISEGNVAPPQIDSSSPARVNNAAKVTDFTAQNANTTLATASFTPPAGSLLVAVVTADTGDDTPSAGANAANITMTVTDSRSLTWTNQSERDKGDASSNFGHASIHTAVAAVSQTYTVTVTRTQATTYSGFISLKVYVVTGQYSSPIGTPAEGSATTNQTSAGITTSVGQSLLIVAASDWSANGGFTSSDMEVSSDTSTGAVSVMSGYKNTGAAAAYTMDLNANGSSNTTLNWAALEITSQTSVVDVTVSVGVVAGTGSAVDGTIVTDQIFAVGLNSGTGSAIDGTVSGGMTLAGDIVTGLFAPIDPVLALDYAVAADVNGGSASIPSPVIALDFAFVADLQTATGAVIDPAIILGVSIDADLQGITGSNLDPALAFDMAFVVGVTGGTFATIDPTFVLDWVAAQGVVSLAGSVIDPTFVLDMAFAVGVVTGTGSPVDGSIVTDQIFAGDLQTLTGSVLTAAVAAGANIDIPMDVVSGTASFEAGSVITDCTLDADLIGGTVSALAAIPTGSASIDAGLMVMAGSVPGFSVVLAGTGTLLLLRRLRMRD